MPSYFDYLDIARSAEDESATATQKLQQGLLALVQAYTSEAICSGLYVNSLKQLRRSD